MIESFKAKNFISLWRSEFHNSLKILANYGNGSLATGSAGTGLVRTPKKKGPFIKDVCTKGGRGSKNWLILQTNSTTKMRTRGGVINPENFADVPNAKNKDRTPNISVASNDAHHCTSPFHWRMSIWSLMSFQEHGFWRQPRLLKAAKAFKGQGRFAQQRFAHWEHGCFQALCLGSES